jgi:hypothetical protein
VFSNVLLFVQNSIVHHIQLVLPTTIKEVANVLLDTQEIQMIVTVAELNDSTNVQPTLNVRNLKCASNNKEFLNVFPLVTVFDVVLLQFALLTIILLNVNVHLEVTLEIQMIK